MQKELPVLPDYQDLKVFLETERKTIVKINAFSEEDDFVRTVEDASKILEAVSTIQTKLWECFRAHPSLLALFKSEFMSFSEFVQREVILELCFLDEYIFPEKELFLLVDDSGDFAPHLVETHIKSIVKWSADVKEKHLLNREFLKKRFDTSSVKLDSLSCKCVTCTAEFRTKLREYIYEECENLVITTKDKIEAEIDSSLDKLNGIFYTLQKSLDKRFYKYHYKLKRSSLNRLESQVKRLVKDTFTYPSPLALRHVQKLRPFVADFLKKQNLRSDLVGNDELNRFFIQMGTRIWRNEKYLEREFKKLIQSVLLIKRKDISATILKNYLGEFWVHSVARDLKRKVVYHMGPTNSGKTHFAIEDLCKEENGCYLAPLRLLAAELFDKMNSKGVRTTLLTGEEVVEIEKATHYSSTIEMARFHQFFDCAVIDEIQMMSDGQRGWAWTRAFVNINANKIHLCGDSSALDLVRQIVNLCGDELEIKEYKRMTTLEVEKIPIVAGKLKKSDALIVFSRKNALKYKFALEQQGFKVSIVYGRLSPEVRREQARKFDEGETDIIVSTDAISMGMNLPIQRIVFSTLSKFFDNQEYRITDSEIKQISGRAGRYLRFPTGSVTCLVREQGGIERISKAMRTELSQKEKCMVGPDLDIFSQVNNALKSNNLPILKLSEFLRLFNTMSFKRPFYCVDLSDMIELAEMVEEADPDGRLSTAEIFGFACAPVNLGLMEHVQYYVWILNHFSSQQAIKYELIEHESDDIDYLETSIKCIELFQWLARHFNNKNFDFDEMELMENKKSAIAKLNDLLSDKIMPTCTSCGKHLPEDSNFAICEECFSDRRFRQRRLPIKSKDRDKGRATVRKKELYSKGARKKKSSTKKSTTKKRTAKKSTPKK